MVSEFILMSALPHSHNFCVEFKGLFGIFHSNHGLLEKEVLKKISMHESVNLRMYNTLINPTAGEYTCTIIVWNNLHIWCKNAVSVGIYLGKKLNPHETQTHDLQTCSLTKWTTPQKKNCLVSAKHDDPKLYTPHPIN